MHMYIAFFGPRETIVFKLTVIFYTQVHKGDNERKKLWDELSIGVETSRLVVVHLTKGNEGGILHVK